MAVEPLQRIIKLGRLTGQLQDENFVARLNAETEKGVEQLRKATFKLHDVSVNTVSLQKANGLLMGVVQTPNPTKKIELFDLANQAHNLARDRIGGYTQNSLDDKTYHALRTGTLGSGFFGTYGFIGGGQKSERLLVTSGRMWWNPAARALADAMKKYAYFDLNPKDWDNEKKLRKISYELHEGVFGHTQFDKMIDFEIGTVATHPLLEGTSPTFSGVYSPLFNRIEQIEGDLLNLGTSTEQNKAAAVFSERNGYRGGICTDRVFHSFRQHPYSENKAIFVRMSASVANPDAVQAIHNLSPGVVPYSKYLDRGVVDEFIEPLARRIITEGPGFDIELFGKSFKSRVIGANFDVPGWKVVPWKKWAAPMIAAFVVGSALFGKLNAGFKNKISYPEA